MMRPLTAYERKKCRELVDMFTAEHVDDRCGVTLSSDEARAIVGVLRAVLAVDYERRTIAGVLRNDEAT